MRRPFPRRLQARVRQRPGLQVAVDELSHSSVRHPPFHQAHQLIVVHPVEALLHVQVHHPAVTRTHIPLRACDRLVGRPPRSKPLAAVGDGCLPLRLQHLPHRLLKEPVEPRWNAECAYPTAGLRDLHPLHRLRSVRPG